MKETLPATRCGNTEFRWGEKTYVMGICNLSPDSFSGDGLGDDIEATIAQANRMIAEGVDIIDVGGESTRPGTEPLSTDDFEDELKLVIPAIERLAAELPVPISIDTYKAGVASRAVEAGASMINDIWGLKRDPRLAQVAAEAGVPIILMANERDAPPRVGILAKVISDLETGIGIALEAGDLDRAPFGSLKRLGTLRDLGLALGFAGLAIAAWTLSNRTPRSGRCGCSGAATSTPGRCRPCAWSISVSSACLPILSASSSSPSSE